MNEHEVPLRAWEGFYVIVGAAAGALAGLQFVVMTLIAEAGDRRARAETISAFGSPNVVHFCAALLMSAIMGAPWPTLAGAGVMVALFGGLGVVYSIAVLRRARRQRGYQPVLEDWIWHIILPTLTYATLLVVGAWLGSGAAYAPFVIGAAVLLLVFIGIHNAWDTVTYMMTRGARAGDGENVAPRDAVDVPEPGAGPVAGTQAAATSHAADPPQA